VSLIEPRIQYTQRTFEDIRQQLISVIQTTPELSQKWTDFNESDLGLVLLELWSAIGDELNFYLDNQANESFISTARQRKSVVNLCKLIAYKIDPVVSSTGIVILSLPTDEPYINPITIPKYTRLSTSGGEIVPFVTRETVTIPAGALAVESTVMQGVLHEEEFISGNTPNQKFILGRKDIASNFNGIEVFIGQGEEIEGYVQWDEAPNFIIATETSDQTRFVVETDADDNTTITFGDGKFGAIPPDGFTVLVRYLSSLGTTGNVGTGKLGIVSDTIYDSSNIPVNILVYNEEACVGGTDRETIEHAKFQAPQELSSLNRAVTRFDGTALVGGIAGISKANVWGEHELPHPDIKHFNQMYVTMMSEGIEPEMGVPSTWEPTTALKNLVLDFIEDKKVVTTRTVFVDPNVIYIDLQLDTFVYKTASPLTVKQNIIDTLNAFFNMDNVEFGKDLRYSNLLNALDDILGVDYVSLKLKRSGLYPGKGLFTGGTSVTLSGLNFQTGATVTFGSNPATNVVVVDTKTITCDSPVAPLVLVDSNMVYKEGFVNVTVTNPDLTTFVLKNAFYYHSAASSCEREDLGDDQTVDNEQFVFGEKDIIIRRNEIFQLGTIEAGDGSDNYVHFSSDAQPMTARMTYWPLYARLNQTITFDATSSTSPYADITVYQWDMGSRGKLMMKDNNGSYVEDLANQPPDGRTLSTSLLNKRDVVYWQYTERPVSGVATVVLTVFDSLGNCKATATPYEVRL
jgi:hypothetical protein